MGTQEHEPAAGGGTPRPPSAVYNWLSMVGVALVVIGIVGSAVLAISTAVMPSTPQYVGILFLPPVALIVLGIILFPLGYLLEKRRRSHGEAGRMPMQILIDFTLARHRVILLTTLVVGVLAFTVFAMGSFQAFTAMETNAFCGQVCHSVMAPEYTAYQHTPHARVRCVECHIGSGVGWYVHAKVSGVRRLTALISGTYARPIPAPITDMRSAKETCEECHWSSRFVGYKEKVLTYYTKGEDSPETKLRLLIKIGGADSPFIKGFGIHYHMQGANKVEYIARDRQRQEIAWVKVTRRDGSSTEFNHQDLGLSEEERSKLPVRRVECLDCHNRPAHEFKSPVDAVDGALAAGTLSRALPYIKVRAVKALDSNYDTTDAAMAGIADSLTEYYKENYPDVLTKQADLLKRTTAQLQAIYKTNFFPEMKAKWSAYPKNIGHRDWPGCFRCHTDKMLSAKGEKVFTDCTKCHLVLAQGKSVERVSTVNYTRGQAFNHPGYDEQIKEYTKCIDCHTGGADLY